jgi:hypothetical protein
VACHKCQQPSSTETVTDFVYAQLRTSGDLHFGHETIAKV